MNKRQEIWQELEKSLMSLLESLSADLARRDQEILINFIENREYGVALEWLRSVIVEQPVQLTVRQAKEMQRLAELMNIKLEAD